MKKTPKTKPSQLKASRKHYRRKAKIPLDAPLHTRADLFNRSRRGTGNEERKVSMSGNAWKQLDELTITLAMENRIAGKYTRGEVIGLLVYQKTQQLK